MLPEPLSILLLLACAADEPDPPICDNPIVVEQTVPRPGTTDVFFRTPFEVRLTQPDNAATLTLRDRAGAVWPGRVTARGASLRFELTRGLEPLTDYDLVVSRRGCADEGLPFRTGPLGDPLDVDPAGRVYRLDLEEAEWVEPMGLLDTVRGFFRFVEILFAPAIDGDAIVMLGAQGDRAGTQDPCLPTFELVGAFDDPYLDVGADVVPFDVVGLKAALLDARVTGAFDPSAAAMTLSVSGVVEVTPFVAFSDFVKTPEQACDEIEGLGGACVPCPDGEVQCVPLIIEAAPAELLSTEPLVEVAEGACP